MVLGGIVAALFAFGDDVMLEGHAILVALHDDQLAPSPGQMNPQRKLVSPGADAMHDPVPGQQTYQRIDRRKHRALRKSA